jgi:hypothetical protein
VRYLIMLFERHGVVDATDSSAVSGRRARHRSATESLTRAGVFVCSQLLVGQHAATSVRWGDDGMVVTAQAQTAGRDPLSRLYLVDCGDLDDAIMIAQDLASREHGVVEIRPVMGDEPVENPSA